VRAAAVEQKLVEEQQTAMTEDCRAGWSCETRGVGAAGLKSVTWDGPTSYRETAGLGAPARAAYLGPSVVTPAAQMSTALQQQSSKNAVVSGLQ